MVYASSAVALVLQQLHLEEIGFTNYIFKQTNLCQECLIHYRAFVAQKYIYAFIQNSPTQIVKNFGAFRTYLLSRGKVILYFQIKTD